MKKIEIILADADSLFTAALRAARLVTRPNVTAGVAYAVNAFLDGRLDLLSPGGRA